MSTRATVFVGVLSLTVLAGCGDDSGATPATTTTQSVPDTTTTVEAAAPTDGVAVSTITAHVFTVAHNCGTGFFIANENGTLLLELTPAVDTFPAELSEGSIAASEWNGAVLAGENLSAGACDDAPEPGSLQPVVTERFPVVDGVVEITDVVDRSVTGRVIGLKAESIDGRPVDVGDVGLSNALWGLRPGE